MRVTHATRCTAVLTPGTTPSFWQRGLFWSKAAFDASPNLRKQLMTTAIMAALGYSFATSTSNAPGTVIGSDGTLQYGAHNLLLYSADLTNAAWDLQGDALAAVSDIPPGESGGVAKRVTFSSGSSILRQQMSGNLVAGATYQIVFWARSSASGGASNIRATTNNTVAWGTGFSTKVALSSTWQKFIVSGVASNTTSAYIMLGRSDASHADDATCAGNVDIYVPALARYPAATDTIPTTSAAVYGPRQTYERGAGSNLIKDSGDLSTASWTRRGTANATAGAALSNGVVASLVTGLGAVISNDIYQIITLASGIRADAAFWLQRVSTSGTLVIYNPSDSTKGQWNVDLSKVSDGPQWISRGHPAVTIASEFSGSAGNGCGYQLCAAAGTLSFYIASSLQIGTVHTAAYLRTTTSPAALYTAGTPVQQNLFANSADMTSFTATQGSWGATTTTPEGAAAAKLVENGANAQHEARLTAVLAAGCTYTLEVVAQAAGRNLLVYTNNGAGGANYDLSGGSVGADVGTAPLRKTITSLGGGWYRCRISFVATTGTELVRFLLLSGTTNTYAGDASSGAYLGQPMLYEGMGDLSYKVTTGTPYSLYYQRSIIRENAATRETLQPRDLTQAAWTKSGSMTAAKTATGTDGVANSSSTLTSGGTNQTCLQVVTSASATRAFSARIRSRSASSLTIDMTVDGGTTWNAVTVNAAFMPYSITQAAVTNPSYGFRLRGNGDAIDVDFVQGEQGSVATSPIWGTESAAQTRSADQDTSTNTPANAGTWCVSFTPNNPGSATAQTILKYGAAHLYVQSGSVKATDGTNTITIGTANANVLNTVALSWTGSTLAGSLNGAAAVSGSFTGTFGSGATVSVGSDAGSTPLVGEIGVWQAGSIAASIAQLASASAGMLA